MNYVAHALVASEVIPNATDAQVFGSMAPDLVGMSGASIVRRGEHEGLAEGVELHFATDRIFDRNPTFTALKARFQELHSEFLSSGAARTCADPGTEMLLDGFVVQKDQAVDVYRSAIEAARSGRIPIEQLSTDPELFVEFNDRHSRIGVPYFYQDPLIVAQRLQRRVAMRKGSRLQFDESLIPQVASVFELQQEAIGQIANVLINQTIDGLREPDVTNVDTGPVAPILPGLITLFARIDFADISLLTPKELSSLSEGMTLAATATGRRIAKLAIRELGCRGNLEIIRDENLEPIFPEGYLGSISHKGDWAGVIATNTRSYSSIGLDIEDINKPMKRNIAKRVAFESEMTDYADFGDQASLAILSAKETIYKALRGHVGRWFGWSEALLTRTSETSSDVQLLSSDLADAMDGHTIKIANANDNNWLTTICYVK